MNTPEYVAVVYDGDGKPLSTHGGDSLGAVRTKALHAYVDEQKKWEAVDPALKPTDPPMWDAYRRTDQATARKPKPAKKKR